MMKGTSWLTGLFLTSLISHKSTYPGYASILNPQISTAEKATLMIQQLRDCVHKNVWRKRKIYFQEVPKNDRSDNNLPKAIWCETRVYILTSCLSKKSPYRVTPIQNTSKQDMFKTNQINLKCWVKHCIILCPLFHFSNMAECVRCILLYRCGLHLCNNPSLSIRVGGQTETNLYHVSLHSSV